MDSRCILTCRTSSSISTLVLKVPGVVNLEIIILFQHDFAMLGTKDFRHFNISDQKILNTFGTMVKYH